MICDDVFVGSCSDGSEWTPHALVCRFISGMSHEGTAVLYAFTRHPSNLLLFLVSILKRLSECARHPPVARH